MAKTAVCKLMLGRTRDAGWLVYDSSTYAFNELTNSEVRRLILDEGINGLEISSRGEIVLDRRFYLTRNMMARSGVGRYHLMVEDDTLDTDEIFFLTKVMKFTAGSIYEVVNNKSARLPFKVETVKRLYAEGILNGATDIGGEIIPCEGVEVEDMGKEGNDADSLSDSWGDVVHGFGSNAACGAAESGQADAPCHVEFDDISDWLKEESEEAEPEATLDEVEAVEEQTKTPMKSSTTKKSKKGAVKSNARAKN